MRFIPTRVHGVLDYLVSALLIAAPWLFGFAHGGAETWVPVILGVAGIVYSLFTDYEMGLVRRISMPAHLALDAGNGAILTLSPWLFGFADLVMWPHAILGILELGVVLMSRTAPGDRHVTVG